MGGATRVGAGQIMTIIIMAVVVVLVVALTHGVAQVVVGPVALEGNRVVALITLVVKVEEAPITLVASLEGVQITLVVSLEGAQVDRQVVEVQIMTMIMTMAT